MQTVPFHCFAESAFVWFREKCVCCSLVQIQVQSSLRSAYNSRNINTSVLELLCVHSNFHREQTWNSDSKALIWGEIMFGLFGIVLNCVSVNVFCAVQNSSGSCIKDSRYNACLHKLRC